MMFDADEVNGLVGEIWSSILGLEARPDGGSIAAGSREGSIASRVRIAGAWRGTVTLHCDPRLACDLAAVMFGSSPEETSPEMVRDAVGELANMTSGSFKSLMPGRSELSLPSDPRADRTPADDPTEEGPRRFGFLCLDRPFSVLIDGNPASPPVDGPVTG